MELLEIVSCSLLRLTKVLFCNVFFYESHEHFFTCLNLKTSFRNSNFEEFVFTELFLIVKQKLFQLISTATETAKHRALK